MTTRGLSHLQLLLASAATAFALTALATPLVRTVALRMGWLDRPESKVKTHKVAVPALGGVAIWIGFAGALVATRFLTTFPTGTLYRLRAILVGAALVFLLGVVDDLRKPAGLGWRTKMAVQAAASFILIRFGISIHFIRPTHLATLLTVLWVVGITNAVNIIDIMDGLAASQAAAAALGFWMIALPSEDIYVNFGAAALLGAALAFLPWNLSERRKIFMGDSGSLLLGFSLAALALGTDYTRVNPLGVYAPLLILGVPMYDTLYVMGVRMMQGKSPFLGSKDHFALRLERMHFTRPQVVMLTLFAELFLTACAWLVTLVATSWAVGIYGLLAVLIAGLTWRISQVDMRS
ncbi:MAG: undecaprenyl/decaprenyl-phosphate alpha-N-acetylglucosaminyl 1-phosphate transferase [Elusimicrobia bacterium]|nr:undecaprenyl/decaprenyl-phosphate alpha-N-acetylglucosaminyl 1-phosphate transferase [Elusimicrobiota bacterium]